MRISSVPRAAVSSSTAKMAEAAWPSAAGVADPSTRAEVNSAANRSPVPFGLIGSFGVRTRQAPARSIARVSIAPAGVSDNSALVTTTVDGPRASSVCACAII